MTVNRNVFYMGLILNCLKTFTLPIDLIYATLCDCGRVHTKCNSDVAIAVIVCRLLLIEIVNMVGSIACC